MRLAVEMLKAPAYPEADFDRLLQQRIRALENVPTEPTQLAAETLQRHLSPWSKGDVLYNPAREEQLAEIRKVTPAARETIPRRVLRRELRRTRRRRPGRSAGAESRGGRAARQLEHEDGVQANNHPVQESRRHQPEDRNAR
jgi:hypothetical protein